MCAWVIWTWLDYMRGMTHWYVWRDLFICVTWLIHRCVFVLWTWLIPMCHTLSFICVTSLFHMCDKTHWCVCLCPMDMTHSYVWHDSFNVWRDYLYAWHDSFICVSLSHGHDWFVRVTWLVHICDKTCLCVTWLFHMFVPWTWLIHICDTTHSYLWHDLFICVTWLFHMCLCPVEMTYSYVCHDLFMCVTWLFHMCEMTHS